jgi:hypothetical protein
MEWKGKGRVAKVGEVFVVINGILYSRQMSIPGDVLVCLARYSIYY